MKPMFVRFENLRAAMPLALGCGLGVDGDDVLLGGPGLNVLDGGLGGNVLI